MSQIRTGQITPSSEAWAAWTPTWTNLTVGNGTVDAKYIQIGKTVFYRLLLIFGSTTSVTGAPPQATTPVTARTFSPQRLLVGNVIYDHTGITNNFGVAFMSSTTKFDFYTQAVSGSFITLSAMSSTVPFTWVTGDSLEVEGFYEVA